MPFALPRGLPRGTVAALFVAFTGFAGPSVHARCLDLVGRSSFRTELNNQFVNVNSFTTGRSLEEYSRHFPFKETDSLLKAVVSIPEGGVWVDMGAGQARALVEGLVLSRQIAEGVAIAFKKPDFAQTDARVPGRFRYIDGDLVENLNRDGKLFDLRGRADLITDVYGPFSYSENVPRILQIYLDLLRPGGIVLLNFMANRSYERASNGQTQHFSDAVAVNPVQVDGRQDSSGLIAWLRTVPGIEVVETAPYRAGGIQWNSRAEWEDSIGIKIRKVEMNAVVPNTLRTLQYRDGAPPTRTFELTPGPAR